MLILALSDAYIPERAIDIPLKFQKLLSASKNKISQILLLGNCNQSPSFIDYLETNVCENIVSIRGESDFQQTSLPYNAIIQSGNFKIGLTSGFMVVPKNDILSLLNISRQLDVDVLLWGGTHNVEAYVLENKFFVNPGSCTGAFNADWVEAYESDDDEDEVEEKGEKHEHREVDTNEDAIQDSIENLKITEGSSAAMTSSTDTTTTTSATNKTTLAHGEEETEESLDKTEIPDSAQENKDKVESSILHSENTTQTESNDTELSKGVATIDDKKNSGSLSDSDFDSDSDIDSDEDETLSSIPSFCLLDIQNNICTVYIYTYIDNEVKVDKVKYEKQD